MLRVHIMCWLMKFDVKVVLVREYDRTDIVENRQKDQKKMEQKVIFDLIKVIFDRVAKTV